MSDNLLTCAHCGSEACTHFSQYIPPHIGQWLVACTNSACRIRTDHCHTRELAEAHWNCRVPYCRIESERTIEQLKTQVSNLQKQIYASNNRADACFNDGQRYVKQVRQLEDNYAKLKEWVAGLLDSLSDTSSELRALHADQVVNFENEVDTADKAMEQVYQEIRAK